MIARGTLEAPSGQVAIPVPVRDEGRDVRLSVVANGPFASVERSAKLKVVPASTSDSGDSLQAIAAVVDRSPATSGPEPLGGAPQVFGVDEPVYAGRWFDVSVTKAMPELRIAFRDGLSAVIDEKSVDASTGSVSFEAPSSPVVETYQLVATYRNGRDETSIVRDLKVYPR